MLDRFNIEKFASLVTESLQDRLDTTTIFSKQRILEVIHKSICEIYMEKFRDKLAKNFFNQEN